MLVLAIADRFLEVIGLGCVIVFTVRVTRRLTRGRTKPPAPKVVSLNDGKLP